MRIRHILFLFLFQFSFSQEQEMSINKIDSICKISKPKFETSGVIKSKKGKVIGGFGITTYNNFSSELIKGEYFEETKNKKSFSYTYFAEYYYFNSKPFYLNLKVTRTDPKNKQEEIIAELNENDLNSERELKNTFLLNLRKKITSINSLILDYKK